MAVPVKFNIFTENVAEGVHDLGADTLKVGLTNTLPVVGNTIYADIVEIAAGNGYTAGGNQATIVSSEQTAGVYTLTLNDVVFTASGGTIGPFRWAVLYNDTPTSPADPLIIFADYGSNLTLADGETFTADFDAVGGALTLT